MTAADGKTLRFTYDSTGMLASVATPSGATTRYTHNSVGDLTSVTDPTGAVTQYEYDTAHRLTVMTTPRGGKTLNVYDAANRVVRQTDPEKASTSSPTPTASSQAHPPSRSPNPKGSDRRALRRRAAPLADARRRHAGRGDDLVGIRPRHLAGEQGHRRRGRRHPVDL